MSTFDKSAIDKDARQYATRIRRGDVGRYVLLPGDPARVDRIATHLDDVELVAHSREFRTVTGKYRDIKVSAMSTGVGCPSASIAAEELVNAGATHLIRVGSTAGIQPGIKTGDIVINTGVLRNDGTSRAYVPDTYPAIADHFLVHALIGTLDHAVDDIASRGDAEANGDPGVFVPSPLAGSIWSVAVKPGQEVKAGDVLFVVESMKAEFEVKAEQSGVIGDVLVRKGQLVRAGEALATTA